MQTLRRACQGSLSGAAEGIAVGSGKPIAEVRDQVLGIDIGHLQTASQCEKIKAICGPDRPTVTAFKLDVERYRAMGYLSDGQPEPVLDLRLLFERYQHETGGS